MGGQYFLPNKAKKRSSSATRDDQVLCKHDNPLKKLVHIIFFPLLVSKFKVFCHCDGVQKTVLSTRAQPSIDTHLLVPSGERYLVIVIPGRENLKDNADFGHF